MKLTPEQKAIIEEKFLAAVEKVRAGDKADHLATMKAMAWAGFLIGCGCCFVVGIVSDAWWIPLAVAAMMTSRWAPAFYTVWAWRKP